MASTSAVELVQVTPDFSVSKVTVTWDNSDLLCQDIVHQLPKGVTPVLLGHYNTTAGTATGTFTLAYDLPNGEVNITALQEVGGSIANMVTVFHFMSFAASNQVGDSLDV